MSVEPQKKLAVQFGEKSTMPDKPETLEPTPLQTKQTVMHPDGNHKWKEWGIPSQALTREEQLERRMTIERLFDWNRESRAEVIMELVGKKQIDKARPIFDILGVTSLPNAPTPSENPVWLPATSFRSIAGFKPVSSLHKMAFQPQTSRVSMEHLETGERTRVRLFYGSSPSPLHALCAYFTLARQSATMGVVLPTCRISLGPGEFCWIGWNRTTEERTYYYPLEADVLFIRGGVAVDVSAMDVTSHQSVMELARKIDALLIKQAKQAKDDTETPKGQGE